LSSAPILYAKGAAPRQLTEKERFARDKAKRRRKRHKAYKQYDLKDMQQFTLCEAMRYDLNLAVFDSRAGLEA
jgi:hypothetical protein